MKGSAATAVRITIMNNHKLGKDVSPKCEYCIYSIKTKDESTVLCKHKGITAPDGSCKKFAYDPLKRVPQHPASLPSFSADEFKL